MNLRPIGSHVDATELYEVSNRANLLARGLLELSQTHAYRYKHFVDNSAKRHDCTYARITLREHNKNQEELVNTLTGIQTEVRELLAYLETLGPGTPSYGTPGYSDGT
jgi:hypothetical protein